MIIVRDIPDYLLKLNILFYKKMIAQFIKLDIPYFLATFDKLKPAFGKWLHDTLV